MNRKYDTGMALDPAMKERRTERLEGNKWKPIPFSEIKMGDTFRLFDDGDDPFEVGRPYEAGSDAFLNPNGIYAVYVEIYTET